MKYEIGDKVFTTKIIKVPAIVKDILMKPEMNLYQLEILTGTYKNQKLWFAEHEIREEGDYEFTK